MTSPNRDGRERTGMLARDSLVPYYFQLYDILKNNIKQGVWKPGDMLPTETELLKQYGLSRTTVRQALDLLVNDRLIHRQRGRGTFVAHPSIEQALSRIISFTEDMRARQLEPRTSVLRSELITASDEIAAALGIHPGEEVALIERLRMADDEPMSLETSYLVYRCCPGVLQYDYALHSLRQTLSSIYNLRIVSALQKLRSINATRWQAQILSIEPGAALLFVERISYTEQNLPIEYLHAYHRGDRYILYNELHD